MNAILLFVAMFVFQTDKSIDYTKILGHQTLSKMPADVDPVAGPVIIIFTCIIAVWLAYLHIQKEKKDNEKHRIAAEKRLVDSQELLDELDAYNDPSFMIGSLLNRRERLKEEQREARRLVEELRQAKKPRWFCAMNFTESIFHRANRAALDARKRGQ